jgi:hypothetical protein
VSTKRVNQIRANTIILRPIEPSLRREALEHLDGARAIYKQRPNHHGVGTVYLNAAYIHLDGGDFQRAEDEAASAYEVAERSRITY